jgi:hypothetical protein
LSQGTGSEQGDRGGYNGGESHIDCFIECVLLREVLSGEFSERLLKAMRQAKGKFFLDIVAATRTFSIRGEERVLYT